MLQTNLHHVLTASDHSRFIGENENVMICCGRMGPMCVPVYASMKSLESTYSHVKFADMEFDSPEAHVIRNAPECRGFMGLPFVVYYRNGRLVKATSGLQMMDQIVGILDAEFGNPISVLPNKELS
jgi:thioredoxin 1